MSMLKWGLAGQTGLTGLTGLLALVLLAVLAGQMGLLQGHAPSGLGLKDGRFMAPSSSDNSVSSQAGLWPDHPRREAAAIAPLPLVGDGPATMQRLHDTVAAMPGARIVSFDGDYLRAEFTTPLMKFTDDAEFWLDRAAGAVQVRSASRLGQHDLGANRKRVEFIRARLQGG
jgi:uncharacterized protein (DUF1499 family)